MTPSDAGIRWGLPGPRAAVRVAGGDAVAFVDNFVTAAVSKLAEGEGTEAFVTDAKGWVIALVQLLRTPEGILLDADAGSRRRGEGGGGPPLGERLRAHLEHHHIREKVEIEDVSQDRSSIVVVGHAAAAWIERRLGATAAASPLAHSAGLLGGRVVRVVRIGWLGEEAFLVLFGATDLAAVEAALATDGIPRMPEEELAAARMEQGFPSADDIPERTLPQELGRDATAISFTKGCYLGQETVARIDAMGHVNRRLTGLVIDGEPPAPDSVVTADGEPVGTVTTACHSRRLEGSLALALVHVKGGAAANLAIDGRAARVVSLPLAEAAPLRKEVFRASRFRVVAIDEPLADGSTRAREIVEHPGSVIILPLLDGGPDGMQVCLVENWRLSVGKPLLELPAGTLDRDEPLAEAARRELAEETGFRAGGLTHAGSFWMSPGILRERMHLFRAEGLVAGGQSLEPGEKIIVRIVGWNEAVAMCLDGRIDDAKSIAGILLEEARRNANRTP